MTTNEVSKKKCRHCYFNYNGECLYVGKCEEKRPGESPGATALRAVNRATARE